MIKEYKVSQTLCDACGRAKDEPTAYAGYHDSGWRVVNEKDLCDICYGMFAIDAIKYLEEKDLLKSSVDTFIENTKPYSGFLNGGNVFC